MRRLDESAKQRLPCSRMCLISQQVQTSLNSSLGGVDALLVFLDLFITFLFCGARLSAGARGLRLESDKMTRNVVDSSRTSRRVTEKIYGRSGRNANSPSTEFEAEMPRGSADDLADNHR